MHSIFPSCVYLALQSMSLVYKYDPNNPLFHLPINLYISDLLLVNLNDAMIVFLTAIIPSPNISSGECIICIIHSVPTISMVSCNQQENGIIFMKQTVTSALFDQASFCGRFCKCSPSMFFIIAGCFRSLFNLQLPFFIATRLYSTLVYRVYWQQVRIRMNT